MQNTKKKKEDPGIRKAKERRCTSRENRETEKKKNAQTEAQRQAGIQKKKKKIC